MLKFNNNFPYSFKQKNLRTETSQSNIITAFCQLVAKAADHKPVCSTRPSTYWPGMRLTLHFHMFSCIHPGADKLAWSSRTPAVHTLHCAYSHPGWPQPYDHSRTHSCNQPYDHSVSHSCMGSCEQERSTSLCCSRLTVVERLGNVQLHNGCWWTTFHKT